MDWGYPPRDLVSHISGAFSHRFQSILKEDEGNEKALSRLITSLMLVVNRVP